MHAFTSVMDASSSLLQSVRAAAAASMAEITVLRTAAHTARLSNVITVWTSVVLHEFYKCLVHKSQVTLSHVSGRRIAFWTLVACNRKQQNRAYDFSLIS